LSQPRFMQALKIYAGFKDMQDGREAYEHHLLTSTSVDTVSSSGCFDSTPSEGLLAQNGRVQAERRYQCLCFVHYFVRFLLSRHFLYCKCLYRTAKMKRHVLGGRASPLAMSVKAVPRLGFPANLTQKRCHKEYRDVT
jgi:hypothetical protein